MVDLFSVLTSAPTEILHQVVPLLSKFPPGRPVCSPASHPFPGQKWGGAMSLLMSCTYWDRSVIGTDLEILIRGYGILFSITKMLPVMASCLSSVF